MYDCDVELNNPNQKYVVMFEQISVYSERCTFTFANQADVGIRTRKWDPETQSGVMFGEGTISNRIPTASWTVPAGQFFDPENPGKGAYSVCGEPEGNP